MELAMIVGNFSRVSKALVPGEKKRGSIFLFYVLHDGVSHKFTHSDSDDGQVAGAYHGTGASVFQDKCCILNSAGMRGYCELKDSPDDQIKKG